MCPACSRLYKGDTFQVMIAGLRGGHGIPETVAAHPAVFVTLTAPGFGLVHRGPGRDGTPVQCRPRRDRPVCEHSHPASCGRRHAGGEQVIGHPLCGGCFDYAGAVLFNAYVPALWDQQVQAVRSQLAADTGLSQRALRRHVRLSFGKVAEYQERGLVHVHAVFRLDGPDGPGDPAPRWANADLLRAAILAAVTIPAVTLPRPDCSGMLTLAWGAQPCPLPSRCRARRRRLPQRWLPRSRPPRVTTRRHAPASDRACQHRGGASSRAGIVTTGKIAPACSAQRPVQAGRPISMADRISCSGQARA